MKKKYNYCLKFLFALGILFLATGLRLTISNQTIDIDSDSNTNNEINIINTPELAVAHPNLIDGGEIYSNFTPTTVDSGVTTFKVWCNVTNVWTYKAGPFNTSFYASLDTSFTESDYYIGKNKTTVTLPESGGNVTVSWNGTFPEYIPDGVYYVGWFIDCDDDVDEEFDEFDNWAYETTRTLTVDTPSPNLPASGDDDDDDDDDQADLTLPIVLTIALVSVGAGSLVVLVLFKKGIIGSPR